MNPWCVVVARNNLSLLKQTLASLWAMDQWVVGIDGECVRVVVVNNGSDSATAQWLLAESYRREGRLVVVHHYPQHSVSRAWNTALGWLFGAAMRGLVPRVLVVNSDSVLRPDTWYWLEREQAMFVTAVGSDDPKSISSTPQTTVPTAVGDWVAPIVYPAPRPEAVRPHPDFSCFMISRECWRKVGPFDECFTPAWFEDNSYHIRMHRAGIEAYSIDLPFWHVGGGAQTLKRATGEEAANLNAAFARNRELFVSVYGCDPSNTEEYEKLFK